SARPAAARGGGRWDDHDDPREPYDRRRDEPRERRRPASTGERPAREREWHPESPAAGAPVAPGGRGAGERRHSLDPRYRTDDPYAAAGRRGTVPPGQEPYGDRGRPGYHDDEYDPDAYVDDDYRDDDYDYDAESPGYGWYREPAPEPDEEMMHTMSIDMRGYLDDTGWFRMPR
ncbi:MAG: hypothetical protein IRZ08_22380, partial [Frankia sp.]|nr:hypothetical protein [Frankia sp.]